jgi:hypothetical protein
MADSPLWLMAVQHAVFLYNHMPALDSGLPSHDIFSKTQWEHQQFLDLHVWGCPVYVLDKTLSDGKKIPKWKWRSQPCIYETIQETCNVGSFGPKSSHQSNHSTVSMWWSLMIGLPPLLLQQTVFLTLTLMSGSICLAPQPSSTLLMLKNPFFPMSQTHFFRANMTAPLMLLTKGTLLVPHLLHHLQGSRYLQSALWRHYILNQGSPAETSLQQREPPVSQPINSSCAESLPSPQRDNHGLIDDLTPIVQIPSSPCRSARQRQAPSCLGYDGTQGHAFMAETKADTFHPICLVAHKDPNMLLSWSEAMTDVMPCNKWEAAAHAKIVVLKANNTWKEVTKSSANGKIIPGTWVFCCKRTPDREIKKCKAQFCC